MTTTEFSRHYHGYIVERTTSHKCGLHKRRFWSSSPGVQLPYPVQLSLTRTLLSLPVLFPITSCGTHCMQTVYLQHIALTPGYTDEDYCKVVETFVIKFFIQLVYSETTSTLQTASEVYITQRDCFQEVRVSSCFQVVCLLASLAVLVLLSPDRVQTVDFRPHLKLS